MVVAIILFTLAGCTLFFGSWILLLKEEIKIKDKIIKTKTAQTTSTEAFNAALQTHINKLETKLKTTSNEHEKK
jgi:hypothetical protein